MMLTRYFQILSESFHGGGNLDDKEYGIGEMILAHVQQYLQENSLKDKKLKCMLYTHNTNPHLNISRCDPSELDPFGESEAIIDCPLAWLQINGDNIDVYRGIRATAIISLHNYNYLQQIDDCLQGIIMD